MSSLEDREEFHFDLLIDLDLIIIIWNLKWWFSYMLTFWGNSQFDPMIEFVCEVGIRWVGYFMCNWESVVMCGSKTYKGHFTHKTESPWPLHFKHSHWWKRRSRSKFASHYAWGTNGVCEWKMDVKSTWIPTSNGSCFMITWTIFKTTSWR